MNLCEEHLYYCIGELLLSIRMSNKTKVSLKLDLALFGLETHGDVILKTTWQAWL